MTLLQKILLILFILLLAGCSTPLSVKGSQFDLLELQGLLLGDYVGMGSRGEVFHSIIQLQVPEFGGNVFYHHISTESLRGSAWQRKVYLFDESGKQMKSTVLLGSGDWITGTQSMASALGALTEEQLLRFPDGCQIRWSKSADVFVAEVSRDRCSYESPAFGGLVSPEMEYRLTRCGLAIDEGIYRQNGSPVFPPSSINARRINPEVEECLTQ